MLAILNSASKALKEVEHHGTTTINSLLITASLRDGEAFY